MKQKIEKVIRSKKVAIALMEFAVAIGCILIFCLFMVPKDRIPDTTHSYSKVEKVMQYKVEGNHMTRVMPLTDYKTFKEIAENTLYNILGEEKYTVKVYLDAEKTQEVTSGYIASGMIVEGTVENGDKVEETVEGEIAEEIVENEEKKVESKIEEEENETEEANEIEEEVSSEGVNETKEDKREEVSYTISVIGDMTKNGDINVTELTKTIKCVIGLSNWSFTEEEKLSADLNEDGQIDITDIETCINYIVFGELDIQEKEYTVTFKNYDGTVISTKTDYHYGDTIEIPDDPTRESDEIYIYKFAGWSPEIAETEKVTKDAEYVATYKAIEDKSVYKVEHYKEELDGTYILAETENLEGTTGEEVTAIAKTYEGFTEDQGNSERKATGTIAKDGSLTLKLYYNRNAYTVTFKNYDGSIVGETKEYFYGQTVSVPDSPTRKADETYTYEFSGWSPEVVEIVTENAEYMAQYTETYIEYSVMFKDYDGTVISEKTDYHYGDTVEIPESPMREADDNYEYEFAGWKKEETEEIGVTVVKKDEEYIATYQEIAYKILIEREDGTLEKYVSFEKAFATITDENIKIQLIGDVTESITISESKNITLDLNNHKITSNQTSTITNNGNLLIVDNSIEKEGMIENTENTVIINNRSLTLGYDDSVVEENILIKGQTTAIQNNNNFYMYDGTLMGKNTITGNNAIIPEGEEYGISIREENGIQIATIQIIEIPQALVGETYYTTLQQAIDENNNEIIYVVKKNIELIDVLTIDETKNLTIDLNGNSITKTANTGYVIRNAGTLTITNTNESNEGTISSTTGSAIYNTANLEIQNVTISSYSYGVYNAKDLNMEDVDIESSNSYGVYNTHTSNDINFTMLRGSVTGSSGIGNSKEGSYVDHTGNIWVQITNATIEAKSNYMIYNSNNYTDYTNTSEITVEIDGGTLKSRSYGINNNGSNMKLQLKNSKLDIESGYSGISLSTGPNVVKLENTELDITSNNLNQRGGGISCSGEYNIIIDKNTKITSTNTSGDTYGIYSNDANSFNSSIQLIDGTISAYTEGDIKYRVAEGVHLNSGYFEFLGGSINATTKTIDASIGSIAEGKQIQTIQEENKYVSTLVDAISTNYVASIGEEKYDSLKEAIAACENTEQATTITMLADYEQWESINISEQKNIILDLNGHKIIAYSEFLNEGQFEVTDTSEEQTGIIEEKTGRAIFNKENGIFTLSGGTILLNSTTLSKCAIYNTDQASINMKGGTIEVNHSKTYGSQYIIYNISTGDIKVTGGELKGDITNTGTLYGIYNYINDEGGDRNVSIANAKIDISYNRASVYGIYNYTTHNSNVTDLSRDTIDLEVSGSNINIEGSDTSPSYGIYNYASNGRDTIKINLKNSTLDVNNNYYYSGSSDSWGGAYGIYNTVNINSSSSFIYNHMEGGSIQATGKYTGRRYGIYNSGRNIAINLGIQGEESQKQEPSILGDTYGINSSSSNTINFFQGIIKGTTAISDTTILSLEEGKEINRYIDETDGYDTIVIQNKTPEAKIGETEYMTLQEAIDACPDDSEEFTTIELIKEVNNSAQNVTVEETKKVTLDLKGYNLTSLSDHTIINNGDLNIIDSVGTGEIKNNVKIAIGNYGNLNVDNIKIYGYTSGITNYSNGNVELNQVEINSTSKGIDNQRDANTIIHSSKIIMDKGKYGIYNSYGTVDMIDSEISVTYGESAYGIYNSGNNTTTTDIKNTNISVTCTSTQPYIYRGYGIYISSGTVNIGEKDNSMADTSTITSSHIGIYRYGSNDSSSSGILNYYAGTITAGERVIQGAIDDTPKDKTISIDAEAQNMSLVDRQEGNVVQVGDIQYATLSEAVETVSAEQEENTLIKVIADFDITSIEEQVNIVANQKISLDLNGHTITSYINNMINNSGKLEVTDTSELQDGKLISVFNTGINNKSEFILNQGTIQAVRNGVYNSTGGSITVNNGEIEVLAQDRGSSAAIYANRTGNVKLLGGTIKAVKNQWSVFQESGSSYIAGLVLNSSYAEIDGGNILVENSTNYCTYGIVTNHSTIDFKSGILEVNANKSGAWNYGISGMRGYNQDGNDIRISGGSIKILRDGVNYAYGVYIESYSNTSQLTMTGGNIEAINTKEDSYTMATAIGTVNERKTTVINILGGRVYASSNSGGTAISGSTNSTYGTTTEITIGFKDGNMNKTNPVIEGNKYGISSGNLKFYDGTIRGATALSTSPTDVEAGYKVSIASSGELQSATLTLVSTAEAIAQIGNLYFNDLQQAINACTELDTINILTAIKCNQTLTIEEGKTITIDLMGNTLTANGIENIIENYGTLNIVDSVGGGSINGEIDNHGQLNQ